MTAFFDFSPLTTSYRAPRTGRTADRLSHSIKRLCEARSEGANAISGGSADTPARTPRRSPATAKAKKGGDDGDGEPARRRVQPLFYDLRDVADALSISTRGVQRLVQEGSFPKPRAMSARRVAWLVRDIEAWAESREVADMLPPANAGQRRTA